MFLSSSWPRLRRESSTSTSTWSTSGDSKMRTWMRARTRWRTRCAGFTMKAASLFSVSGLLTACCVHVTSAHPKPARGASGQLLRGQRWPHAEQSGGAGSWRRLGGTGQAETSHPEQHDQQRDVRHNDGPEPASAGADTPAAPQRSQQRSESAFTPMFLVFRIFVHSVCRVILAVYRSKRWVCSDSCCDVCSLL